MTQRQDSNQSHSTATHHETTPQKGEVYRCEHCGMEMQCTVDCHCQEPEMVRMECCGHGMNKA